MTCPPAGPAAFTESEMHDRHAWRLVKELREQNELLTERVRQLEEVLGDQSWVPGSWSLGFDEVVILNVLVAQRVADSTLLGVALYGNDPDGGANPENIRRIIGRLRRKLKSSRIEIITQAGLGWSLTGSSRQVISSVRASRGCNV